MSVAKERRRATRWKVRALVAWIIIFTAVVIYSIHRQNDLADENRNLIALMQESRTESCVRTYTVMQAILSVALENTRLDVIGRQRINRMRELANPENCIAQTAIGED